MARTSIRRRFLVGAIASASIAIALFAAGAFAVVWFDDDAEIEIREGESYRGEATEVVLGALLIAAPLALLAAIVTAVVLSRRSARPLELAIIAARETTAQDLRRTLPVPDRDDELRDLAVSLNELFVRLDDGFGALERFAADASHELRTPLAVMATELEIALRHTRPVAEWETTASTTLDELRRMSALVEGLLTLARAGTDAPSSRRRIDLVEHIDNVVAQVSSIAEQSGIELSGPPDGPRETVIANGVMIETAVRNLVENALAATKRGGRVHIKVEARGAAIAIVVDDDGRGIDGDANRLFEPFQRGQSDREARGGVGLGLAIVRRVAVVHGGVVTATKSPRGGARFVLTLPRAVDPDPRA